MQDFYVDQHVGWKQSVLATAFFTSQSLDLLKTQNEVARSQRINFKTGTINLTVD